MVSEAAEARIEAEARNVAVDFFERYFLWCAVFTLDCSHAFGYVGKVCAFLAGSDEEAKKVFRKAKDRMYEHGFDRAEKYLKGKYKAWFADDGMERWSEEAAKAWRYLDARRRHMNYGTF